MIKLYGHELSGNSYKAKLMLSLLDLDYEWVKVDLMAGAHKQLGHPTIADIAVFPYIALAPDGRIALDKYLNVLNWINRVKNLPGFIGMIGIEQPKTVKGGCDGA